MISALKIKQAGRRFWVDRVSTIWMFAGLSFILVIPLAIFLGLLIKSLPLLYDQSIWTILSGTQWSPMKGNFGFLPFIVGSVLVTILAVCITAPTSLMTSIYITQFAPKRFLKMVHPVIDILAGIPSVIYGVWGILTIVPLVAGLASWFGIRSTGYSILAGGIVLAVMSTPYVLNMLIEVFRSMPVGLKEASLSLGSTYWECIKHVLLRKGLSGILAAFALGVSNALGNTIAVLMVVGNRVQFPSNVFEAGYPIPALIANNYGEMMSIPLYDSALMLAALLLFVMVTSFNFASRYVIQKSEVG
ncbi:phosphate ABC transporter permease subunit PstC [Rhodohalobacter sp. 614A]|uniref:phosphate ABC transporter permease subunit PstC n=1 Tax=Rhodohalobacter sp. 614A TaxID=2908649 RepID=UPI001F34AA49|nr:phosphate ABC transporter permease subunit PstC [Rhodohalobacter sp. 614A]